MNPRKSLKNPDDAPRKNEELIAAYVCGDLDEAGRAAVEHRMAEEPEFRGEVQKWMRTLDAARAWLYDPPPGIEKVSELPMPALPALAEQIPARAVVTMAPVKQGRRRARAWALQWLAAAALFLLGLFTGRWLLPAGPALDAPYPLPAARQHMQAAPAPPSSPGAAPSPVERPAVVPPAAVPDKPAPVMQSDADSGRHAPSAPVRSVREANGRLIVESTLASTGAQAVWVVDGNFQLAQANSLNAGGSQ